MPKTKFVLNVLSAIMAIVAAILWIQSARARIPTDLVAGIGLDHIIIEDSEGRFELLATLSRSALLSGYAAYAAASAALLQAISLVIRG
jgi:hypothetical protein